jgi:hypothetical protein
MNFRELTESQEKLRNEAHTRTLMHTVDTNGWSQLDHSRRWIMARDGSRPEMDDKMNHGQRLIATRYGSLPGMNG